MRHAQPVADHLNESPWQTEAQMARLTPGTREWLEEVRTRGELPDPPLARLLTRIAREPVVQAEKKEEREAKKEHKLINIIVEVLEEAGEPTGLHELTAAVQATGKWETKTLTPSQTIYSCISQELKLGEASRVVRTARAQFAATSTLK